MNGGEDMKNRQGSWKNNISQSLKDDYFPLQLKSLSSSVSFCDFLIHSSVVSAYFFH